MYRNKGLATKAIVKLIRTLLEQKIPPKYIGLNVESSNTSAFKLYEKIGFVFVCDFVEAYWEQKI